MIGVISCVASPAYADIKDIRLSDIEEDVTHLSDNVITVKSDESPDLNAQAAEREDASGDGTQSAVIDLDEVNIDGMTAERAESPKEYFDARTVRAQTVDLSQISGTETIETALGRIIGAQTSNNGGRLQRQTVAFRGAAAQDIGVSYRGVPLNALSDASADFSFLPGELLGNAHVYGTGAGAMFGASAGFVELTGNDSEDAIQTRIFGSSLLDYGLFVRGRMTHTGGATALTAFGDRSEGEFQYIDGQGTREYRHHNAASRLGGQLDTKVRLPGTDISAFSLFSLILREEPGVSEYPSSFERAGHREWLSLTGIAADFDPGKAGDAWVDGRISAYHRAAGRLYENPASYIGSFETKTDALENQTRVSGKTVFYAGGISETALTAQYEYQRFEMAYKGLNSLDEIYDRHVIGAGIAETVTLWHDRLKIGIQLNVDCVAGKSCLWSPLAAVSLHAPEWLEIWFSSGMSERFPSFDELYYETEFIRGNPDLRPQRSIINELGIAISPVERFRLTVSAFYNLHWDMIRFMPVTPNLYIADNVTDSFARGVEIALNAIIWRGFGIDARYAWTDASTIENTPIPGISEHRLRASLFWHGDIVRTDIALTYDSPSSLNASGSSYMPHRISLDADFTLQITPNLSLSLAIYNLLNDMHRQDAFQRPLPGRYAGVSVQFRNR